MEFRSPTYGVCKDEKEIVERIFEKILSSEHSEWTIAIGTDSQNNRKITKFCTAVLLTQKGKGGIYFYSTHTESRFHVVQNRMLKEAELSIELGRKIMNEIDDKILSDDLIEKDLNIAFEIHCDLGNYGKSRDSIKAAVGWIASEFGGLVTPKIKPESYAASSIADKYTR